MEETLKAETLKAFIDFCKKAGVKTENYINEDMTVSITGYPFKKGYVYEIETIDGEYKITDSTYEAMMCI